MRKPKSDDGTPPPPKPRKLFKMEYIIWDDGEITNDLKEIVYGERGAPKAWFVDGQDFVRAVNSTHMTTKDVLSAILKSLEMSEEQLKRSLLAKEKDNAAAAAIGNAITSAVKSTDDEDELAFEEK